MKAIFMHGSELRACMFCGGATYRALVKGAMKMHSRAGSTIPCCADCALEVGASAREVIGLTALA